MCHNERRMTEILGHMPFKPRGLLALQGSAGKEKGQRSKANAQSLLLWTMEILSAKIG